MRIAQHMWTTALGPTGDGPAGRAQWVLAFGPKSRLADPQTHLDLRACYPQAVISGCSTAGEIIGRTVADGPLVTTAVHFDNTTVASAEAICAEPHLSHSAGLMLGKALDAEGLVHVFVLADGQTVNGTDLVCGLRESLPSGVTVTGGLAGDGTDFGTTLVGGHDGFQAHRITAVGLYGSAVRVGCGSLGGWEPFGPERLVTHADGNQLFELDGQPALALYKKYLGEHAAGLPATGLLFPLSIRNDQGPPLVRTILAVDESKGSLVFAGTVPQGTYARLMKANFDRLVDGAAGAARASHQGPCDDQPQLAVLISCVGRRLLLKQRVEDELDGAADVLGEQAVLSGFYSYGEICPYVASTRCEFHNQTMTITTLKEE